MGAYRREVHPPAWFAALALVAFLAGMIAFAEYLMGSTHALPGRVGMLVGPCIGILSLGVWLAKRREQAIIRAIKEEAPALYEKLREERVIQ